MANAWNSHISSANGSDNSSAYLGVNAGLSWDGWLLKHIGNLNWQQQQESALEQQPDLSAAADSADQLDSQRRADFTNGEFFDTIGLRVGTWRPMTICSRTACAPTPLKFAAWRSNALVTVRQGSNIIYQTTVPPGPFTGCLSFRLRDEVSVKEAMVRSRYSACLTPR
jgi:outer membrane usher protein